MNERRPRLLGTSLTAALASTVLTSTASAQSIIKQPGNHPDYVVEAEPHLVFAFGDPPGSDLDADSGMGLGARFAIPVAQQGLLPKLNDSVAIGFGADYVRYTGGSHAGRCIRWESGPAGTRVCTDTTASGGSADVLLFPLVFQWNFWLTEKFSVFGEPGLALTYEDREGVDFAPFVIWAGGRFHFSEVAALTLRLGYPSATLGVSFLL